MTERARYGTVTAEMGRAYVRVLGRQLDRFVEFEFFLNDGDLSVELVMPDAAFAEFCEAYGAEIVPSESIIRKSADEQMRVPGLYKAPNGAGEH